MQRKRATERWSMAWPKRCIYCNLGQLQKLHDCVKETERYRKKDNGDGSHPCRDLQLASLNACLSSLVLSCPKPKLVACLTDTVHLVERSDWLITCHTVGAIKSVCNVASHSDKASPSATPILCCPGDIHSYSLTNDWCNGNEMRANNKVKEQGERPPSHSTILRILTLQTPHAGRHSSLTADDWLAWHSMPVNGVCMDASDQICMETIICETWHT